MQSPISIVARRGGNLLEISSPGGLAPHPFVRSVIENNFVYNRLSFLRGADAYDPITHEHVPVLTDRLSLFRTDANQRIVMGLGYQFKFYHLATQFQWNVKWEDVAPPPELPAKRFVLDWEAVRTAMRNSGMYFKYRQEELLHVMANNDFGQIDAAPNFGKTFLFRLYAFLYPHARIHIVVPGRDVIRGAVSDLRSFMGRVGEVHSGKQDWARVTVVSMDSLHHVDFTNVLSEKFADIVLVDEAHALCTESRGYLAARYEWCKRFCLSGTLQERGDNSHQELEQLFGPIIFSVTTKELHENGTSCPVEVHWLPMNANKGLGDNLSDTRLAQTAIWFHDYRNASFAAYLSTFGPNVQTLVMVKTIDHAVAFKRFAPHYRMCYGSNGMDAERYRQLVEGGFINPDTDPLVTPSVRDHMRDAFRARQLLHVVTTPIWSTGVNFENLQVLARLAGDRSDVATGQEPHRVIRLSNDKSIVKEHGIIVDSRDQFNKKLSKRADHRRSRYNAFGWKNVYLKQSQVPVSQMFGHILQGGQS